MTPPEGGAGPEPAFWRVFPWDSAAPAGAPYSPEFVVPAARQKNGRFDLTTSPVLYLAETPAHAVAERLRAFAGRMLKPEDLIGTSWPLGLARLRLDPVVSAGLADLTDPETLLKHGIRPDALASPNRAVTQAVSRKLYFAGLPGFRWWSALHGDWHVTLLFADRLAPGALAYDPPELLAIQHPAVIEAARTLRMELPER